jgi:hypothetical protein
MASLKSRSRTVLLAVLALSATPAFAAAQDAPPTREGIRGTGGITNRTRPWFTETKRPPASRHRPHNRRRLTIKWRACIASSCRTKGSTERSAAMRRSRAGLT